MAETAAFELEEFVPYLLNRAAEESGQSFQKVYKQRYGMLRTEWRVLAHLGRHETMTATEIGRSAGVHKTKISRAVARLEARRFLVRTSDASDRRQEILRLTPGGRAAYADISARALSFDSGLMARFTEDEQAVFRRCLKAIAAL